MLRSQEEGSNYVAAHDLLCARLDVSKAHGQAADQKGVGTWKKRWLVCVGQGAETSPIPQPTEGWATLISSCGQSGAEEGVRTKARV